MRCRSCGTENRGDAAFCRGCGTALQTTTTRRPPLRRILRSWRLLLLLAIVLAVPVLLYAPPLVGRFALLRAALGAADPEPTVVATESLLRGIQSMSTLTTAKYSIQTIVAIEDRGALGPLTRDRLLLRASGDVFAGIDLAALEPDSLEVDGRRVTILLPEPTLVSSDIVYDVFDRNRGIFAPTNKDLQSLAEQQAREDIVRTACEKGILEEARRNAETTLSAFVTNLGYDEVAFAPPEQPQAPCIDS
jgi:hypothetical protein